MFETSTVCKYRKDHPSPGICRSHREKRKLLARKDSHNPAKCQKSQPCLLPQSTRAVWATLVHIFGAKLEIWSLFEQTISISFQIHVTKVCTQFSLLFYADTRRQKRPPLLPKHKWYLAGTGKLEAMSSQTNDFWWATSNSQYVTQKNRTSVRFGAAVCANYIPLAPVVVSNFNNSPWWGLFLPVRATWGN